MTGRRLRFLLWALSLTLVGLLVVVVSANRASPGPLSAAHAQVPGLQGDASCNACHGGWFTAMSTACRQCHEEIDQQLEAKVGLHGVNGAEQCAKCHGEHHGAAFQPVNRLAFALAGVEDPARFDHERIGFPMAGRHLQLACDRCHPNADVPVLAAGQRRYAGLDQACGNCHEDVHQGQMQLGCASCHGQSAFPQLEPRDHDRFVPLAGAHGVLECGRCHNGPSAFEVLGPVRSRPDRTCVDCHDSPHQPALIEGVASAQQVRAGASCGVCHLRDHTSFTSPDVRMAPEHHALAGFELAAPHDRVACGGCHPIAVQSFRARHPGRSGDRCVDCHADPHGGQFDKLSIGEHGCTGCHARERWSPSLFGATEHARTMLPLDGVHATTACNGCHREQKRGEPRRYHGTPWRCESCHADVHPGAFTRIEAQIAAHPRGRCAACHVTVGFGEPGPQPFDHGRSTGFGILGAHAQAECEACHKRRETPDVLGRTFGRIAAAGTFRGCITCHDDPHAGRFDRSEMPAQLRGMSGCERCHDTVSFRALPHGFDHGAFTGFALLGAHQRTQCSSCHARREQPGAEGRTWSAPAGKRCADCHADVHLGQFLLRGANDCERCHRSAESFQELVFDHDRDARFPLREAHSRVRCSRCHLTEKLGDRFAVRYRPLRYECSDCHGPQGGLVPARPGGGG